MNKIFLILLLTLLLTSCNTVDMIMHPNDYKKKEYNQETRIIYDTIQVKFSNENYTLEPVAGELPVKKFVLSNIGEKISFRKGEPVEIISNNIDFSRAAIQVITDENNEIVTMKLSDRLYDEISFDRQCQCVEIRNIEQLPPIKLNPELDPHQIILTPIFNNCPDCELIGYQIRYGDQQLAGCWNEAKEIYNKFKCCVGQNKKKPKRTKNTPVNLMEEMFGSKKKE